MPVYTCLIMSVKNHIFEKEKTKNNIFYLKLETYTPRRSVFFFHHEIQPSTPPNTLPLQPTVQGAEGPPDVEARTRESTMEFSTGGMMVGFIYNPLIRLAISWGVLSEFIGGGGRFPWKTTCLVMKDILA